ncbi:MULTISPECIES: amino acid--[acyl-carrier-protein] ligase [Paraburkholderia]|uniref:amino acid--[acyl-carrier-protein] ligase n=1 Tax=Paraburkholderia TaxID=1822464 RepID=UPI0022519C11|nr:MULTISPECIES: amino acid--[acyl-carrier-protein] ligase [Paraburkholderia]MCX4164499.1 amino acid--[acyl-carrier-protein] ligase [Paraburkholderia megapolitana]MDN7159992.1 amino acid--[acyl-carrier-protein] ligase [Paraburkholderia sp. CHISQ3]MDQ6497039.1 amino acid--[acyl-carrier-protein] ligase [Paraburkholderia megapolitana]
MNTMTDMAALAAIPGGDTATPTFRDALLAQGLLIDTGENGLYGRSEVFEDVVERLNVAITHLGADQTPEVLRFPPAMRRTDFEDSEYLKSFPNLAGTIHSFCGNDMGHQRLLRCLDDAIAERDDDRSDEWMAQQKPTRVVLTPAACYPIYPVMARRGPLPADGRTIDVLSYCFRHEPSLDPARMQMFRQREYVRLGTPDQVMAFREMWIERGSLLVTLLDLPVDVDLANDPFFGRGGKIIADSQRAQALKFELLIPVANADSKTACLSFNYHMDHFGAIWKIECADGSVAHTGCVGFGMERITLALFRHHGLDVDAWPADVRALLWGDTHARVAEGLAQQTRGAAR